MDREHKADDRGHERLPPRLHGELGGLEDRYEVRWDDEDRAVILENVELPDGFTPRVITVQIDVPTGYPHSSPRVVLPWSIRSQGAIPRQMLISMQYLVRGGVLGDPIIFWPEWDQSETLKDVVEHVLRDLARMSEADRPAAENPETASVPWNPRRSTPHED